MIKIVQATEKFFLPVSFSGTSERTISVHANRLEPLVGFEDLFHFEEWDKNNSSRVLPCPIERTKIFGTVDKGGLTLYQGSRNTMEKTPNDKKKSLGQANWPKVF